MFEIAREAILEQMLYDMCDLLKSALRDLNPEEHGWKRTEEAKQIIKYVEDELTMLDRQYVREQFYKIVERDPSVETYDENEEYISIGCADAIEFVDENNINLEDPMTFPLVCMYAACVAAHHFLVDDFENERSQKRLEFVEELASLYESLATQKGADANDCD